jgi:hypothetical protein
MTYLRLCSLALAALSSSCGLIDSDVTEFDLTLPDKAFSVDASGWQVNQTAADTFLNMSCTQGSQNVCMSAAMQACPMNCDGDCGSTNKCELALNISAYKGIDLVAERPELNQINDKPVIKVEIESVRYAVPANTLNVATPEMGVFVAPITVMDPKDPMAKQIGIIASVPAGATVAARDMEYTADGKQILIDTMSTYKNPFNVIVGTSADNAIVIAAGQMVPTGKLDAVIQIKAHAGL